MNRRDFVGAMAALFGSIVLPEPLRPTIRIATGKEIQQYTRIALDDLTVRRAQGSGSFEALADRIFKELWDKWVEMEHRHALGVHA